MSQPNNLLRNLEHLSAPQLRRLLTEHLTQKKLGLCWESSAIERDAALNANIVLPRLCESDSHGLAALAGPGSPNLIIEGDNFDSLRLLKSTHAGKIRVIYIDPPYNIRYNATVIHADEAGCKRHAAMGFESGGGAALDQWVAMIKRGL